MSVIIVTGAAGLIGSECVKRFHSYGYYVVGIDNNSRKKFFGETGSTESTLDEFLDQPRFTLLSIDITDYDCLKKVFEEYHCNITAVIHTAALPAHQTCDADPLKAFHVNVTGTVNILECMRKFSPAARFQFISSSKVYGNRHSDIPFIELDTRYDLPEAHELYNGIPETWNPDQDDRSFLGSTKLAADAMVQQYALTHGIRSTIWRPGCLVGPNHRGVEAHGFLSYLTRCGVSGKEYTVHGYNMKQVRDNWHASDMVRAFAMTIENPKAPILAIYNIGGSRFSNCSMKEAIDLTERFTGKKMNVAYSDEPRKADHKWFIGDARKFLADYPMYKWEFGTEKIIEELVKNWQKELA